MLPGAVLSNMTKAEIAPFAIDTGRLSGGMTLYLSTSKADYLIGGVCSVNCKSRKISNNQRTD